MMVISSAPEKKSNMLDSLPNEMLNLIVNNVNDIDLLALRLANKRFRDIASPIFAIAYFQELKVFMSRHSLKMLNDICAHEVLGRHVRSINFASQRLLKAGLESTKASMLAAEDDCRFMDDSVDAAMDFTLAYSLNYGEQQSMAETGEGILLLTSALEKLRLYNKPIRLGLVDSVWNSPEEGVLGSYTFGHECFEQYNKWNYWECVRTGTLKTMFTAAYRSECPIDRLSIKFEDWSLMMPSDEEYIEHEDPDIGTIDLDGFEDYILANMCRGLLSFDLKLLNSFHDWDGETPTSVARVLELASNLQVLRVDVGGASYTDFTRGVSDLAHWEELETLTSALSTRSLRELYLTNCMIPETDILHLIWKNSSFRVLEISNCCIGRDGAWSTFLNWLLDHNIQLERLILTDLYRELDGDRYFPVEFIVAGTREFGGSEHTKTDLQQFVFELLDGGF